MARPQLCIDTGDALTGHVGDLLFTNPTDGAACVPVIAEVDVNEVPTGRLLANGYAITAGGGVVTGGGRSVKLMSALRALVGAYDGEAVHVAAHDASATYYTRFPAGGGVFIWDAGSTHPDDNAMVIAPTAGGGRWKRGVGQYVTPEMFGAVGNANWMDENPASPTFGVWYQDQAKTIVATDDSAAMQAAMTFAGQPAYRIAEVRLSRWYLIGATVSKPDIVSIVGTGHVQSGSRTGSALCASHAYSSSRQATNAWSNPVLLVSNRASLAGGGRLADFGVLGTSAIFGSAYAKTSWADRCGMQFHFGLNVQINNVTVIGFKRAGASFVAAQDIPVHGLWVTYCGTDDGTDWFPGMEFLRDPTDSAGGVVAGVNAIHFSGLRLEGCNGFMNFDNGTSNLGEIHFVDSKIESPPGWTYNQDPIQIKSGFGPVVFGSGLNVNFPTCMTAASGQLWVFQVRNANTKFDGCIWFGGSQFLYHNDVRGVDVDSVKHNFANPALLSFWIFFNGRVGDFKRLDNFVAGGVTRQAVRLGVGGKITGIHFGNYSDPTVDQTAGALIRLDPSEAADTSNSVSGITLGKNFMASVKNYAALVSTGSSAAKTMSRNTIKREEVLIGAGDVLIDGSSVVDAAGCDHIVFDVTTTAKTVSQLKNGWIGQRCALAVTAANAGNVTVAHNSNIILTGGADVVLSSYSTLVELLCLDGAVWRQV